MYHLPGTEKEGKYQYWALVGYLMPARLIEDYISVVRNGLPASSAERTATSAQATMRSEFSSLVRRATGVQDTVYPTLPIPPALSGSAFSATKILDMSPSSNYWPKQRMSGDVSICSGKLTSQLGDRYP